MKLNLKGEMLQHLEDYLVDLECAEDYVCGAVGLAEELVEGIEGEGKYDGLEDIAKELETMRLRLDELYGMAEKQLEEERGD